MQDKTNMKFTSLRLKKPINHIKLLKNKKGVKLVAAFQGLNKSTQYNTNVDLIDFDSLSLEDTIFEISQLLPSFFLWDVYQSEDNSIEILYELNGGALNSLIYQNSTSNKLNISHKYPLKSFHNPRFVKNKNNMITASLNKEEIVLFSKDNEGFFSAYKKLDSGYDALLFQNNRHYVLFSKIIQSGPSRLNVLPGILYNTKFSTTLKVKNQKTNLFNEKNVYEFDACLTNKTIYLLSIVENEILIFKSSLEDEALNLEPFYRFENPNNLTKPTIICDNTTLWGAFLENPGKENSKILTFKFLFN